MTEEFGFTTEDSQNIQNDVNIEGSDQLHILGEEEPFSRQTAPFVPSESSDVLTAFEIRSKTPFSCVTNEGRESVALSTDVADLVVISLSEIDSFTQKIDVDNGFSKTQRGVDNYLEVHDGVPFLGKEHSSYTQSQIDRLNDWADQALKDEKWHYDRAEAASDRGDEVAAKKHIQAAKQCHNEYDKYMRSIKAWEG